MLIEVSCPALGGRFRLHGQLELPKQPPIVIDLKPAARVWFKVPEQADAWSRARFLFWHPGERVRGVEAWWPGGIVPEAFSALVHDGNGVRVVAETWQVMGLDEDCRMKNRVAVGDWSPTVLMETSYYVRADL